MNATYDRPTRTLTVVLDEHEDRQFVRIRQVLGIRPLEAQLETWLLSLTRDLAAKDLEAIKNRIERANASEIDAIKTALGIG